MDLDVPVVGILRGIDGGLFHDVMVASFAAGLQALEITMNTDNVAAIVSRCRPEVEAGKLLGVGTVRNVAEAKVAIGAGAMFLVTPNTDTKVIEYAADQEIPVIAGAFTPTEVYNAWAAGAAMVKIFPCGVVGPGYIRELRGPFEQIPMVAVGGVSLANLKDYFRAGATGVGVGSALFGGEALLERNVERITENVGRFVGAVSEAASDSCR